VRAGRRVQRSLADEVVEIGGYGTACQLSLVEDGAPVLPVLTSDRTATGAALLCWLRSRWRIENAFIYAAAHHGIDALADFLMDIGPDQRMVTNPARTAARAAVAAAEAALVAAERALPQLLAGPATTKEENADLPGARAHRRIEAATRTREQARAALRPVPAKVAATELDPDATRARPRIERGCWPTTARRGWPSISTPTWPTPTSTGPSCATCSTSVDGSTTSRRASPSPWTGPVAPESPTRSSCSPTSSTPPRRTCPATVDHWPTSWPSPEPQR
jgi:hypothetical protein